jgi:two-component system, OmpR family, phosphate regulon sensor histidine kinase PhoR
VRLPETFAARIAVAFSLVVAALFVAGAWFTERHTLEFHEEEVARRLDAVAGALEQNSIAALSDPERVAEFAKQVAPIATETSLRFTLIRRDGEVVHDTERAPPLASHGDRPEFVAALANGRGTSVRESATTSQPTFYLARRLGDPSKPIGALRIGASLAYLDGEVSRLERALYGGALAVVLLGILFAVTLSRLLARPLEAIAIEATAVANGEESGIIRVGGPREVRRLADAINAMAGEMKSRLASIESARAEMASILESLREGVVAVARDERLLRMNSAAAGLLGLEQPLLPGQQLWRAVRFPELETALRRVIAEGTANQPADATSPRGDGTVLSVAVTPLADGRGAVAILSDVTAIRRLEKVRSDFVANVSHEMRTPLAIIMGALETLVDPTLEDSDRSRFLEMAQVNADRMKNIVDDLLELSRIEAEGEEMALAPVDVEQPVRSAAKALQLAADSKRIRLVVEPPSRSPIIVDGHAKRLEQVFTNLIDNAIKYTPDGGTVIVRVMPRETDVTIEVEDTGIGIPTHSLQRVFERFYRVDKGRSRQMGGTGLGLAIVKHATRAHGGRVSVRSEEGRGTTFSVTLPLSQSPPLANGQRPGD